MSMHPLPLTAGVGVIGAGAMGAGIAQIAAVAGHPVWLFDVREGAADHAISGIRVMLDKLLAKQKISVDAHARAVANLRPATSLTDLKDCHLAVEAIVESLDAKRCLFAELEALLPPDAILASNTSSISITTIGAALKRPERMVGMHFFNPAPLMPLVEVISGAATDPTVADTVFTTATAWGKTPVHARSTPGFIVNRVARPFYAESLRLLQEGAADAATLDAIMREAGGFKMGPFELMDLIGHDVNYAVTRSVFDAFYGDPRFAPSLMQLELVNAGFLGRKSGRGFYDYADGATFPAPKTAEPHACPSHVTLSKATPLARALALRLRDAGITFAMLDDDEPDVARLGNTRLMLTDGRSATRRAVDTGHDDTVLIDLMLDASNAKRAAIAIAKQCSGTARDGVIGLLQAAGFAVSVLDDAPGLAVMRTVAMLANEACDAVHQQVCNAEAADLAMRGGVGYPIGPLEWADRVGAAAILTVLDHLMAHYGEPRYRASPLLRQCVWAGETLRG